MTFASIISAISTVGFPIAACVILYLQQIKQNQFYQNQYMQLKEAIDNNSKIMGELLTKIKNCDII